MKKFIKERIAGLFIATGLFTGFVICSSIAHYFYPSLTIWQDIGIGIGATIIIFLIVGFNHNS